MSGIDSVQKVLAGFREKGGQLLPNVDGYHGTLIENMNCEKKFYTAVEVTAGNK